MGEEAQSPELDYLAKSLYSSRDEILLRSNSDRAAGLTLLNLGTFTYRQLDEEELKIAG
jgi:hypothetical protein